MVLDRDPHVTGLAGQYDCCGATAEGRLRTWTPGHFARYSDAIVLLADCPSARTPAGNGH